MTSSNEEGPSGQLEKAARLAYAGQVFTPGSPVSHLSMFAGRWSQIRDVANAVGQTGQHAVIYGERGVGKTSLSNVLTEIFGEMKNKFDFNSARVNCNSSDSFATLWITVLRELEIEITEAGFPTGAPTPEDIRHLLGKQQQPCLIIIDELDRLDDDEALSLLADTVKTLSDHSTPATVVLVGVADSIMELIGDHQSVERALVQIPMPRMSLDELKEIVDKGAEKLDLTIGKESRLRIARLSDGLPHYTHLLALYASQRAITDDRNEIIDSDVSSAIQVAVEKVQHSILSAYRTAIRSTRSGSLFKEVLLACALADKDDLGYFSAGSVRQPMSRIMGKPYEIASYARHLDAFTKFERGSVLIKNGQPRNYFYRFQNPILQPYVILMGIATGTISEEFLEELARFNRANPELPFEHD